MNELMNRKGDVTVTTVILIILGLVVLVMLIVGFTKGTGFFFNLFDSAPSEVQALSKFCEGYIQASLSIDYCTYRLLDISGEDELVNCQHPLIKAELDKIIILPAELNSFCDDSKNDFKKKACDSVAIGQKDKIKVNSDKTCSILFPSQTPNS